MLFIFPPRHFEAFISNTHRPSSAPSTSASIYSVYFSSFPFSVGTHSKSPKVYVPDIPTFQYINGLTLFVRCKPLSTYMGIYGRLHGTSLIRQQPFVMLGIQARKTFWNEAKPDSQRINGPNFTYGTPMCRDL